MRSGILAAGNFIIDIIKMIDIYPQQDSLANIKSETFANGGSPYNILKDLAKLNAPFTLHALGLVGNDEKGDYVINDCKQYHIDTTALQKHVTAPTSYTDVMTVENGGRRTFFHNRGANAHLSQAHFEALHTSNAKIFHLAYLLLLDKLDEFDGTRTHASMVFEAAQKMGFKTSTDMVSEDSERFHRIVPVSLPYIDYLFVNEVEAERITGIATRTAGIDTAACHRAGIQLLKMGVHHTVFIHFPEGCIAVLKDFSTYYQPSLKIPQNEIVGAVGAGDAFAAGVLYGVHQDLPVDMCLKLGVCVAASCLFSASSSDGILPLQDCLNLEQKYGFVN
ncbi:MAG: carbohydrate kinase family protein [Cytophagales bacterium]|nr:carbohydrate kinase family protein [Cytophagales bacterium]